MESPPICRQYKRNKKCRFGDRCKFRHEAGPRSDNAGEESLHSKQPLKLGQVPLRRDGALDIFFATYPHFDYNRGASSSQQFDRLCGHYGWKRGDPEQVEACHDYKTALVVEFNRL